MKEPESENDARVFHGHVARNKEPIAHALADLVASGASVLEVGSGSGEHAAYFAQTFRHREVTFQPTEFDPNHFDSIRAWLAHAQSPNLKSPERLDVTQSDWGLGSFDVVYAANVIHIVPWAVTVALFAGAARHLSPRGKLITYGPYRIGGRHTAESNAAFDARLRERDPSFGIRDFEALELIARGHGFVHAQRIAMPANNFLVSFERA